MADMLTLLAVAAEHAADHSAEHAEQRLLGRQHERSLAKRAGDLLTAPRAIDLQ